MLQAPPLSPPPAPPPPQLSSKTSSTLAKALTDNKQGGKLPIRATLAFNAGRTHVSANEGQLKPPLPNLATRPNPRAPVSHGYPSMRGGKRGPGKTQGQRPPASAPARVGEVPPCTRPPPPRLHPPPAPGTQDAERAGVELTAASVAVAVAVAARAPGVLYDHALAAQFLAVQLVNGVVGVAGVLELHEAVPGEGRSAGRAPAAGVSLAGAARSRGLPPAPTRARSRRRRHFGGPATRRRGLGRLGPWGGFPPPRGADPQTRLTHF